MANVNSRGVVLEVSLTSMKVSLSKTQLNRIQNNHVSGTSQVDKELVALAIAHSYRSHQYRAGDIYRRTTKPFGPNPLTLVLQGPTEVPSLSIPLLCSLFQKLCLGAPLRAIVFQRREAAIEKCECETVIAGQPVIDGPTFCIRHPRTPKPAKTHYLHCIFDDDNVCFVTADGRCLYVTRDQLRMPIF